MDPEISKLHSPLTKMSGPVGFRGDPESTYPRALIGSLSSQIGKSVHLSGMVETLREFKKHFFIVVRDRSGIVQVVVPRDVAEKPPAVGAFVSVGGQLNSSTVAKLGYEILANRVAIEATPRLELAGLLDRPLDTPLDQQLDNRAITLRNKFVRSAFLCQAVIGHAFRQTMEELGFIEIHTPKIVSGGTEGGAQVFKVDYFGSTASLAQSPQLYKQIAAGALERVYEIGPVFRAENSSTNRHLTEFTGLDFEMAHIQSQEDLMDVEETFIKNMLLALRAQADSELSLIGVELPRYENFPRVHWDDVKRLIEKHKTEDPSLNFDRAAGEAVKREYGNPFVFIYGYPTEEKPFYIQPSPDNPARTESFDLLFDGLEISSGGERIHDYDLLMAKMVENGLSPEDNPAYRQAFEAGMPRHGGGGMGLERLAKNILGLGNVREATLFPRDVKRVRP